MPMRFFLTLLLALAGGFSSTVLLAQTAEPQAAATTLDEKTQKKVDKAMADLVKDRDRLLKDQARYDKDLAKYEKKKAKGDLSPNDIIKSEKGFKRDLNNIENLKKRINDNQAFLDKSKQ